MTPVLSRAQMRAYDKYAIETGRVPSIVLMENAARGAADVIVRLLGPHAGRVAIVCGTGNNGGDGFAVARHLLARGFDVTAVLAAAPAKLSGDALTNRDAYVALGGRYAELAEGDMAPLLTETHGARVIVDALFGTGLARPVEGHYDKVIAIVNQSQARRIAIDVPSGLDADSGSALGHAVKAHDTITFGALKMGLLSPEGARLAGRLHLVDLGVPARVLAAVGHEAELVESAQVAAWLRPRDPFVYKHAAGSVLAVAGSAGTIGAALLVGHGSLRAGAGLVTLASWPEAAQALESRVLELMTTRIDRGDIAGSLDRALAGKKVVVIGPGFGTGDEARRAVEHVVLHWEGVKIVDADALTIFAGRLETLASAKGSLILTPHPGEAARLLGVSARDVESDRPRSARQLSDRARAVAILKGAHTLVAVPGTPLYINASGNPALATAGAGDVLAGIMAAFACVLPPERAAVAAVHVHGLAADVWRARHDGADRGLFAHEIADAVPAVLAALAQGKSPLTV
jgi:NAD(P)H-hydrate epimerase